MVPPAELKFTPETSGLTPKQLGACLDQYTMCSMYCWYYFTQATNAAVCMPCVARAGACSSR